MGLGGLVLFSMGLLTSTGFSQLYAVVSRLYAPTVSSGFLHKVGLCLLMLSPRTLLEGKGS